MKDVDEFDKFFEKNYSKLKHLCESKGIELDILNDSYLKLREFVNQNGFNEENYLWYCYRTIVNQNTNYKKSLFYNHLVYIERESPFWENIAEDMSEDANEERRQFIAYHLFKYLSTEIKCSNFEIYLFKIYYLSKGKMTYSRIRNNYGVSKSTTSRILRKIKKELKEGFPKYLEEKEHEHRRNAKGYE